MNSSNNSMWEPVTTEKNKLAKFIYYRKFLTTNRNRSVWLDKRRAMKLIRKQRKI